jgi:8-oxo-dGTP pyrophosphatase MutT (NUDIX family)
MAAVDGGNSGRQPARTAATDRGAAQRLAPADRSPFGSARGILGGSGRRRAPILSSLARGGGSARAARRSVDHDDGLTVLLTQRATHLKNHAGQISFPGGRLEASDEGPLAAALRETEEEIGLSRQHVTFAGYLDPHLVLSGFWVTPVVGFVQPGFALALDRREVDSTLEVDSTFEVPLLHILDPANHKARERTLGTTKVRVYDIPYGEHHIWGATAGMLIALYRLLNQ